MYAASLTIVSTSWGREKKAVKSSLWHVYVLKSEPLSKCSVFFLIFSEVACFSALYVEYVLESRLKSFRNPPNNIKASV